MEVKGRSAAAVLLAAAPVRMNEIEWMRVRPRARDDDGKGRAVGKRRVKLMWDRMWESNYGNGEIGNSGKQ